MGICTFVSNLIVLVDFFFLIFHSSSCTKTHHTIITLNHNYMLVETVTNVYVVTRSATAVCRLLRRKRLERCMLGGTALERAERSECMLARRGTALLILERAERSERVRADGPSGLGPR